MKHILPIVNPRVLSPSEILINISGTLRNEGIFTETTDEFVKFDGRKRDVDSLGKNVYMAFKPPLTGRVRIEREGTEMIAVWDLEVLGFYIRVVSVFILFLLVSVLSHYAIWLLLISSLLPPVIITIMYYYDMKSEIKFITELSDN